MLHFIPDAFVPSKYTGNKRRYLKESVSLAILLIAGVIFAWMSNDLNSGVITFSWWQKLRMYLHGTPCCPLCGGTRSFLWMCRGNLITAMHYSFFGVFFFFSAVFHFLLKTALLITKNSRLEKIAAAADRNWIWISVLFILWAMQLILHYSGVFQWYTLLS